MKIGFKGLNIQEGKIKYIDKYLEILKKIKYSNKIVPYFFDFFSNNFSEKIDAIIISHTHLLDILILDIEKIELLLNRNKNENAQILQKCINSLENEIPICDMQLSNSENEQIRQCSLLSYKPILIVNTDKNLLNINDIIEIIIKKSNNMFFYTVGPKESRSWLIKTKSSILKCAKHIHTDLANGFIRAEISTFDKCLKKNEYYVRDKKDIELVTKEYIVQPNDIINIRFNI